MTIALTMITSTRSAHSAVRGTPELGARDTGATGRDELIGFEEHDRLRHPAWSRYGGTWRLIGRARSSADEVYGLQE